MENSKLDIQSPASAFSPEQPTQSRSPFSVSATFSPSSITGPVVAQQQQQQHLTLPQHVSHHQQQQQQHQSQPSSAVSGHFNVSSLSSLSSTINSPAPIGGSGGLNPALTDVQMVRLAAAAEE